jgi:intracellular sulfur oxidation DsrE/DsrF family protein
MARFGTLFVLSILAAAAPVSAAEATPGPAIREFGAVYTVEQPVHAADPKRGLRAVIDVGKPAPEAGKPNPRIETAARFLNVHARAGLPMDKVEAVVVLHGGASPAALSDESYRKRHDGPNPDAELIARLRAAGVRVYLCGQSAAYRGYAREELSKDVDLALSAMTVLTQLQADGYALILF